MFAPTRDDLFNDSFMNCPDLGLGPINGHIIGRILKDTVRRATVAIRNERFIFEAKAKEGLFGKTDDVLTNADLSAQEVYLRTFTECFPFCGVIGEENDLRIESRNNHDAYFTVDPLDGTKAFVRKQSDGVGTMVALVYDDEVISAYVGDINTQEIYGYRPGSNTVHRIAHLDTVVELGFDGKKTPGEKYALMRDPLDKHSEAAAKIVRQFKEYEVIGSSIGIWMARLWKQEVGMLLMRPATETPWDSTPIIGITKKLGYKFLRYEGGKWAVFEPILPKESFRREYEVLIVHENDLKNLAL